jgi:hypothetical protein
VQRLTRMLCQQHMRNIIFVLTVAALFTACTKAFVTNNEVQLRIHNNSSNSPFDSVIVNSPGGKQVYYNVASGTSSGYKTFSFLYSYAYIEVHFNNQMLKLQPIDYVGEEKLKAGKYSYKIGIVSSNQSYLSLECKKD